MRLFKGVLIVIGCFLVSGIYGQTSQSVGGDWHTGATWIGGSVPATNNSTIVVDGPVESDLDLIFNNNVSLTINSGDTLIVNGDLEFNNGANLVINSGAVVIVRGNFVSNNNLDLAANAYLIVFGDLTLNNNSDINSTSEPSQVFVGGTADWGNGTTGNVLDCPGGTGYDSDCNYGNIVDLITDPIFEIISGECTPAPSYNAGGEPSSNSPVAVGATINLTANPDPGTGASFINYVWVGPDNFAYSSTTTPNTSIASATVDMDGDYIFAAFTDAGCYLIDTTTVVVSSCTDPTITGTTPGTRCGTGTVALGATASAGTVNWYDVSTGGAPIGTGTSFTTPSISTTTTYYVDATDGSCTTASRTAIVATVNPLPTVSLSVSAALDTICNGDDAQIIIDFTAGVAPFNFTVSRDDEVPTTITEVLTNISTDPYTYTPLVKPAWVDDGSPETDYTYSVTVITDNNGCANSASQGSEVVTVLKIPQTGPQHHIENELKF